MIFVELRCEDMTEKHADGDAPGRRCWSYDNNGCGQFSADTLAEGTDALRQLFEEAKDCGWERLSGHGWVCPHCMAQRNKQSEADHE